MKSVSMTVCIGMLFTILGWTNACDPQEARRRQILSPSVSADSRWSSVVLNENLPAGHPRKYRLYYAGIDYDLEKASFDTILKIGMLYGIATYKPRR